MSAAALETLVARLLTDAALRERFIQDRAAVCSELGLDASVLGEGALDPAGLELAARSLQHKVGLRRRGWGQRMAEATRRGLGRCLPMGVRRRVP